MPALYTNLPVKVDAQDLEMRCYALMRKHGISMQDLADHLNATARSVKDVLHGINPMSVNFLVSFCAAVGCTINDVLPFSNTIPRYPYKYVTRGGGGADDIAPDPYRIVLPNPDIVSEEWKEVPKSRKK